MNSMSDILLGILYVVVLILLVMVMGVHPAFVKAARTDAGYFLIAAGDCSGAAGDAQCHRCGVVSLATGYYYLASDRIGDRSSGADFIMAAIFSAALRAV